VVKRKWRSIGSGGKINDPLYRRVASPLINRLNRLFLKQFKGNAQEKISIHVEDGVENTTDQIFHPMKEISLNL
jgi:hypothetical protein